MECTKNVTYCFKLSTKDVLSSEKYHCNTDSGLVQNELLQLTLWFLFTESILTLKQSTSSSYF